MAAQKCPVCDWEITDGGVARISYGPGPYRQMIDALRTAANSIYSF